jgi:hypothetical protein
MTAPRDADRLIQAFLSEGETDLPDRAYEAVRRDIHRTHQRVVLGPWREPHMSTVARVAIAAAAVVAIGLAWINFGPQRNGVGVLPTPSATTAPTPSPSPKQHPNAGAIEPGRYWLNAVGESDAVLLPRIAVTLPAGWTADGEGFYKNYSPDLNPGELDASDAGAGPALVAWQMSGTFVDPCTNLTLVRPTPGPGIDALAAAYAHQPGTTAGPPTAVTVDGYSGKFVELTVTADITKCADNFHIWASPDGNSRWVQGTNEMNRMYILDVGGHRFTFNARIPARTTAADRAELQAVIDSIHIEPKS